VIELEISAPERICGVLVFSYAPSQESIERAWNWVCRTFFSLAVSGSGDI